MHLTSIKIKKTCISSLVPPTHFWNIYLVLKVKRLEQSLIIQKTLGARKQNGPIVY